MDERLAILFADVCGSSKVYESLGDHRALEIVGNCLRRLSKITTDHRGKTIKTIGDEIMCSFANVNDALAAAMKMQQITSDPDSSGAPFLRVRIGVSFGTVIANNGDVFGDMVNLCHRVAGLAKPGQILATDTVAECSDTFRDAFRKLYPMEVKGKASAIDLHEMIWDNREHPTTCAWRQVHADPAALLVMNAQHAVAVGQGKSLLTFGRSASSDIVVGGSLVSRDHGQIIYRQRKFVLIDCSSNGSFVKLPEGREIVLRREELILPERGMIGCGKSPEEGLPHTLTFAGAEKTA